MSAGAIIMLIVSLGTVWGGLAAAIIHLRRHPDDEQATEVLVSRR
ncbi:methionine/alanine import family NSS transporter small subunit [Micrococcoides hystricis]|uniref:Methionine/alanine import family NSS transporter small subunit n=1 Tax=Micrococcoides hystricis TaxID=1572761 RepID=A0ABV6P7N3_9MICC